MSAWVRSTTMVAFACAVAGCGGEVATTSNSGASSKPGSPEAADHAVMDEDNGGPIFSVNKFDASADPAEDLVATVSMAQKDGRRILIEVGGNW